MSVLPIALTGGIAEGKTTVLRMLNEQGMKTASADEIAKHVLDDPVVQAEVLDRFKLDSPIDRSSLAKLIASDPSKRRELNSILHAEVLCAMLESGADVIEVPLLVETCLHASFRRIWVVTCGEETQFNRLVERLGSAEEARARLAIQLPTLVKCAFADKIIRTDRPIDAVLEDVRVIAQTGSFS